MFRRLSIAAMALSMFALAQAKDVWVPKEGSSCSKCADNDNKGACKKCPDTVVVSAENGIEFQVGGSTIYELNADGPIHSGTTTIQGDVVIADTGSLTAMAGASMDLGDATANTLRINGDENIESFRVQEGSSWFNGRVTVISPLRSITADIYELNFHTLQDPFPDANPPIVTDFGGLPCDADHLGTTAVAFVGANGIPVPLNDPSVNVFDPDSYNLQTYQWRLMFCAPGKAKPGWMILGNP